MSEMQPDFDLTFLDYKGPSGAVKAPLEDAGEAAEVLDAYSKAVVEVVANVGPAVAHVGIKRAVSRIGPGPYEGEGAASGVIITPDGYMVTNSHVVRAAEAIDIGFADG
ncbi:MAG: hypothetical protein IBX68_02305 [Dehalococcoidia bacterium]|nr:hypothetical protein [Dehalococcoidia bacterium]